MNPKEKAEELVKKFQNHSFVEWDGDKGFNLESGWYHSKHCALIAVNEILKTFFSPIQDGVRAYWEQVKKEIEKA